jgi:hypothetical protein
MADGVHRIVVAFFVVGCRLPLTPVVAAGLDRFESAPTVQEVRRQIEKLPGNASWWTVNGRDMAWNNKNLNRIFPTVNVYRAGPVRWLERQPMPELATATQRCVW